MSLYGNLSRSDLVAGKEVASNDFYEHPAYLNMHKAQRKLEMIQSMVDEVLAAVPETPTKGAAVMQLHTASMWLDKAMSEGYKTLQAAFLKMEEDKKVADRVNRDYERVDTLNDDVPAARRATKRA